MRTTGCGGGYCKCCREGTRGAGNYSCRRSGSNHRAVKCYSNCRRGSKVGASHRHGGASCSGSWRDSYCRCDLRSNSECGAGSCGPAASGYRVRARSRCWSCKSGRKTTGRVGGYGRRSCHHTSTIICYTHCCTCRIVRPCDCNGCACGTGCRRKRN